VGDCADVVLADPERICLDGVIVLLDGQHRQHIHVWEEGRKEHIVPRLCYLVHALQRQLGK
jgi:hypothetical protein